MRVQPCIKSLLRECWLWKEPVWSRRFEQYTLLVFRRMLDCRWWCCLSSAWGMHIRSRSIQAVFSRWSVGVGCWLDVCALECVSVVVSCCWKGWLEKWWPDVIDEESDVLWNCVVCLYLDCLPDSALVPELDRCDELGLFPVDEMILFLGMFETSRPHRLFSEPTLPQKRFYTWLYPQVYYLLATSCSFCLCINARFILLKRSAAYEQKQSCSYRVRTRNLSWTYTISTKSVCTYVIVTVYVHVVFLCVHDKNGICYSRGGITLLFHSLNATKTSN